MRKESSNQFTEGLISDLNPINTPNTVLTDALNATVITYDGNEYSLQNDKGNYALENCKLKENYIPVGLKEYGDILYIVSYNPLTKHVEIGTYPSPAEVISSKNKDTDLELQSVIEQVNPNNQTGEDYSKLIEKCQLHVWTSDNEEDSKLYPGDSYKIEEINKSPYKYEELEYFIIDDDRQKHNISDLIEIGGDEFHSVPWQIPGWIAAQYRIGTFDDFIMSIKSIEAPTISTNDLDEEINCTTHLNFQLRISDKLFLPEEGDYLVKADLGIDLEFVKNNEVFIQETVPLTHATFIDWYSDSKILWLNYDKVLENLRFNDTITIKATPCLKISTNGIVRKINYDSFSESFTIFLNSVGSYSDFNIASNVWKFYIDEDDDNNLYIEYDVLGPLVTKTDVQLYYRVKNLQGKTIRTWQPVDNYGGVTSQGIGVLQFDDFNENALFKREGIYVLDFVFYKSNASFNELDSLDNFFTKLIIASKIFFDFVGEYSDFNQIGFDDWISKYSKSIVSDVWQAYHSKQSNTDLLYKNYHWDDNGNLVDENEKQVFTNNSLNKLWNIKDKSLDKGWVTSQEFEDLSKKTIDFIVGYKGSEIVTIQHNALALEGKLWENTPEVKIEINSYLGNNSSILVSRSDINSNSQIGEQIIDVIYGKRKSFGYVKNSEEFTQIKDIRNVKKIPLMWMNNVMWNVAANDKSESKLKVGGFLDEQDNYDFPNKPQSFSETTITVNRDDVTMPNTLTKALLSGLGDSDFGILGVLFNIGNRKYGLYHGNTEIVNDKKTDQRFLFTYLVFKKANNDTNNVVLIPFDKEPGDFWKRDLQNEANNFDNSDWWHEGVISTSERLTGAIKEFVSKLKICYSDDAIKKGSLINIVSDENTTDIPICDIVVKTPEFYKWMYDKYDLLNVAHRLDLINSIGEDVCGNLLRGSIDKIPEQRFYSMVVEKSDGEQYDLFLDVDRNVIDINNSVNPPELVNQNLLDKLQNNGGSTKGVYWTGASDKHSEIINLLNRNYISSKIDQLNADSSNIVQMYTDVGNDHNKLYIAYVENKLIADIQ